MNKRGISLLLTLCMIVTLFSGMTLSAGAVEAETEETTAVETVLPEGLLFVVLMSLLVSSYFN